MAFSKSMDLCSDLSAVDPNESEVPYEEYLDYKLLEWSPDPSVAGASTASESVLFSPSENTFSLTNDNSEVSSNAPSFDLDRDEVMRDAGAANNRNDVTLMGQTSGLGSSPLLIPVLFDKHMESTVVNRPAVLPPTTGLMAITVPVRPRQPQAIAPKLSPGSQLATVTSWGNRSSLTLEATQETCPRSRNVKDAEKVAKVRESNACVRCRIHKISVRSSRSTCTGVVLAE
jgi:hypothetical protein